MINYMLNGMDIVFHLIVGLIKKIVQTSVNNMLINNINKLTSEHQILLQQD